MKSEGVNEVRRLIHDMVDGKNTGNRLMLDPNSGKMVVVSQNETVETSMIQITPEEANMFCISKTTLVITVEEITKVLDQLNANNNQVTALKLYSLDDKDVFRVNENGNIKALFYDITNKLYLEKEIIKSCPMEAEILIFFDQNTFSVKSYWMKDAIYKELRVIIPPVKEELFSRINGIYETAILSNKKVGIIGLGSGGSPIALELAKQGVQHFLLIDPDRLEIENISRHICGICDLGRYKTKAVQDMIKNKNPYATIITVEKDFTKIAIEEIENLFIDIDLVICCTDNRESKLIINRFCIEHDLVCIYGGAFRRAYGGQVLRVIPYKTMCYQCYISGMPNIADDIEISNDRQTKRIAYSDIPNIPIEPGLSTDIAPISIFIVKLAILELLKGDEHTLHSLYDDLEASLYFWFNRREPGSQWKNLLSPMEYLIDKMSILRWYGVHTEKNKKCPVCGNYCRNSTIDQADYFK